jgi:hypothetical protein
MLLIYPPGDHLFRHHVCGRYNAWLVHDLQPVEVGVKWDDVAQFAHARLEHCLGIVLRTYGLRGAKQGLITC